MSKLYNSSISNTFYPLTFYSRYIYTSHSLVQAEAMRTLQDIQTLKDTKLAACLALVTCHKKADVVDREAVQELEATVRPYGSVENKNANGQGRCVCGVE